MLFAIYKKTFSHQPIYIFIKLAMNLWIYLMSIIDAWLLIHGNIFNCLGRNIFYEKIQRKNGVGDLGDPLFILKIHIIVYWSLSINTNQFNSMYFRPKKSNLLFAFEQNVYTTLGKIKLITYIFKLQIKWKRINY